MNTTTTIDPAWSDYDKTVATCHLHNWGVIYLDEYEQPIDVEEVCYLLDGDED